MNGQPIGKRDARSGRDGWIEQAQPNKGKHRDWRVDINGTTFWVPRHI